VSCDVNHVAVVRPLLSYLLYGTTSPSSDVLLSMYLIVQLQESKESAIKSHRIRLMLPHSACLRCPICYGYDSGLRQRTACSSFTGLSFRPHWM